MTRWYRVLNYGITSLPRLEAKNGFRRERVVGRESVGRRVTRDSLEQRLRRVFLTSLVRSTPRTQSANECRLVSQLILSHPFYREVACERAKCRRLRGRRRAGEGDGGGREVGKSLSWKARTPYLLHDQNTLRIWYAGHAWPPHTTSSSSELRRKALPNHPALPRHFHADLPTESPGTS